MSQAQIAILMESDTEPRLADLELVQAPGPHPAFGAMLFVTEELPDDAPEEFAAMFAEDGELKLPLGGCVLVMN